MKCLKERPGPVDQLVAGINTRQIAYVKGKQDDDGGFGDLFSTNLAIQVFIILFSEKFIIPNWDFYIQRLLMQWER